jgi:hypothetical protein
VGRVLALWKERSSASFEEMLGAYGVDTIAARDQEFGVPALTVVDPVRSVRLCGARALDAVTRDPRRVALLARAGRHDDAKAAQLEVALRPVLPLLRMTVQRGSERAPLAAITRSAGAIAALVLAGRALDLTKMAEVLAGISLDAEGDDEPKLVATVLDALGRHSPAVALAARRALSSPELGA